MKALKPKSDNRAARRRGKMMQDISFQERKNRDEFNRAKQAEVKQIRLKSKSAR